MRPLIGIVTRVLYPGDTHKLVVNEANRMNLVKHGADVTAILPPQDIDYTIVKFNDQDELTDEEKNSIIRQINNCDGILMPGGFKINKYDRYIIQYVIDNDIPVLGICMGMQVMSNYKREVLWNEKNDSSINHLNPDVYDAHEVTIDKDSRLFSIINKDKFMVNSRHSYHILENEHFDNVGFSDDGYIEAIEMKNKTFVIGVQWHPENRDDEISDHLFTAFVDACKK